MSTQVGPFHIAELCHCLSWVCFLMSNLRLPVPDSQNPARVPYSKGDVRHESHESVCSSDKLERKPLLQPSTLTLCGGYDWEAIAG
jgi:hypothetical protein